VSFPGNGKESYYKARVFQFSSSFMSWIEKAFRIAKLHQLRIDGVDGYDCSFNFSSQFCCFGVLFLSRQIENESPIRCDAHCTTVTPLFANERVYCICAASAGCWLVLFVVNRFYIFGNIFWQAFANLPSRLTPPFSLLLRGVFLGFMYSFCNI